MSDTAPLSDFERTAKSAEALAQRNLSGYKTRLFLFGVLGYAVIVAMLLGLMALVFGMGWIAISSTTLLLLLIKNKLIFVILPVIWVLMSSLWVKLEPPAGYRVTRDEFPDLFNAIETVRKKLDAPRVHDVILTPELNAAICQTPRLGIFGWNRNTLILGVELLLVLTPAQAAAVVGHELGHLSGNHSRFNGWIYRVRQSWYQLMAAFDAKGGLGSGIIRRFFDWYAPRFAAYSFALARANEYEADALSAQLTDSQVAADALVNVYVAAPFVDEQYWQRYFRKADDMPEPDHPPWAGLRQWLATDAAARGDLSARLGKALARDTTYEDTHPCLRDRLAALKVDARLPGAEGESAAAAWLGDRYGKVIDDFDNEWLTTQKDHWRQRYDYAVESRKALAELEPRSSADLSDDELWKKATLTEEFGSAEAAVPLYREMQSRHPENAAVAFALGRLIFEQDDDEVLEQMRIATTQPEYTIAACQVALGFLHEAGREDEAQWWLDKANEQAARDQADAAERSQLAPSDDIVPIQLPEDSLAIIVEQLCKSGKVRKAWIAQKVLSAEGGPPALAIAVTLSGVSLTEDSGSAAVEKHMDLNCTWFIVPRSGNYKALAKKIIKNGDQII